MIQALLGLFLSLASAQTFQGSTTGGYAILKSSGQVVVQSTATTRAHNVFEVRTSTGYRVFSIQADGGVVITSATFTGIGSITAASITVATLTAHGLGVLGPATFNTQGGSSTFKSSAAFATQGGIVGIGTTSPDALLRVEGHTIIKSTTSSGADTVFAVELAGSGKQPAMLRVREGNIELGAGAANQVRIYPAARGGVGSDLNVTLPTSTMTLGVPLNISGVTGKLSVATSVAAERQIALAYYNIDTNGPQFGCGKSHSNTLGTITYPVATEELCTFSFTGGGESNSRFDSGAYIGASAPTAWTASNRETVLNFGTVINGETNPSTRLSIGSGVTVVTTMTILGADGLQVRDLAGNADLAMYNAATGVGGLGVGESVGTTRGRLLYGGSSHASYPDAWSFQTNASDRMLLNATGLGIGTINPATKLHLSSGTLTVDGSLARFVINRTVGNADEADFTALAPMGGTLVAGGTSSQGYLAASADAFSTNIRLAKTRSTGSDANTIVQDGDSLGSLTWAGADGAVYRVSASLGAEVDGTPGSNDMPTRIVIQTTPDGSGTASERVRIDSKGHVEYTGTAPTLTTCGTTPAIVGNDNNGRVTIGTGGATSCVITFAAAWTNAPQCFCNNHTTANLTRAGSTTTTATSCDGTLLGGDSVSYFCVGRR